MSNTFHLAVPAGDLEVAVAFYCTVLGCTAGNSEKGHWADIDFWGNELTLHQSTSRLPQEIHPVDMGEVPVPHFGVHLTDAVFQDLKQRLAEHNISYVKEPYRRFKGTELEQETFFIEDTNANVLEIKTMVNPHLLFAKTKSAGCQGVDTK